MNPFYLKEAGALVAEDGLTGGIRFLPGSAEALPFPDAAFDAIFSVTVLEECDADGAIAEMVRVVVAGGRIGIIVRSLDLPQWWNLDLPEPIRHKIAPPPRSVAAKGVADASLYRRAAGRAERSCLLPALAHARPAARGRSGAPAKIMRSPCLSRRNCRSGMPPATRRSKTGLLMTSWPFHCAVGTKAGAAQG
jgi:SAM-dependent methyltransferase